MLGFAPADGGRLVCRTPSGYELTVLLDPGDYRRSTIDFGPNIKVWNRATSSFRQSESLVVLECVLRLLRKGYDPKKIELEKHWKLGHRGKGRLDILLRDPRGRAYAMIECKTWGEEYAHERSNVIQDGGQLFSYFVQERSTRGLYLYASKVEEGLITFNTEYVETGSLTGDSSEALFMSWDRTLHPHGLFHDSADKYDATLRNLRAADLRDLDRESGTGLFNSFAETLRRHTLSDKSNAFNKIFNLFVCKIADEGSSKGEEETRFQWKIDDTPSVLLERLQELYREGLHSYLEITVQKEFFSPLAEFAFLDIYDEKSYGRNAQVLKEVVQLLQGFRLRYSARHQFLGDFFEMLLNTGVKQEAGQFFTPTPLARFVLRSLPVESLIREKVRNREAYILPYLIDYACGSGHFVTEGIEEIQAHIETVDEEALIDRAQSMFRAGKEKYLWTREYVYGVEEDYRLAKTTKIATFLNGDGDATIIRANGLDDFFESVEYRGRLKTGVASKTNPVFDIVVSNPPFAVPGFLNWVKAPERFDLARLLTLDSSEIECLFIERTFHLLRPGGVAGVILPLSVLSSTKSIHAASRALLLLEFDVVGLVELRSGAFSESTSATVCVFLRKRRPEQIAAVAKEVFAYFAGKADETSAEVQAALREYGEVHPELEQKFIRWLDETRGERVPTVLDRDAIPLMSYVLNHGTYCVIAYSGDKRDQEAFLGYRFSGARGKEGIHLVIENGSYKSLLYDPGDPENRARLATHIRANFSTPLDVIPQALAGNAQRVPVNDLIDGNLMVLRNPSGYFAQSVEVATYSPFGDFIDAYEGTEETFGSLFEEEKLSLIKGVLYRKSDEVPFTTARKVLTADNLDVKTGRLVHEKYRYLRESTELPEDSRARIGDIIVSVASGSLSHLGKAVYVDEDVDAYVGGFLSIIRTDDRALAKAVFYNLLSERFRRFVVSLKDQNINNLPPNELKRFTLHIPRDLEEFQSDCMQREEKMKSVLIERDRLRTH